MFVTFEGVDGSGKSTQARLLAERLRSEGREVVLTREPGGTSVGEQIREILLHGESLAPWAEAALFAAARAQLVDEVIRPALARGADVVSDRYLDSSLAYQGLARGLGVERVLELNLLATSGLLPDRTFLARAAPGRGGGAARRRAGPHRGRGPRLSPRRSTAPTARSRGSSASGSSVVDGSQKPEDIAEIVRGQLRDLP